MPSLPGTKIAAKIVPSDSLDTYATHRDIYGQGGHRSVADLTARDAITTERRSEGMICYVEADQTNYQLIGGTDNSDWVVMTTGGTSGGFTPLEGTGMTITASGSDYIFSVEDYIGATEVASISGSLQTQIDNITGGTGANPAGANYQIQFYEDGSFGAVEGISVSPSAATINAEGNFRTYDDNILIGNAITEISGSTRKSVFIVPGISGDQVYKVPDEAVIIGHNAGIDNETSDIYYPNYEVTLVGASAGANNDSSNLTAVGHHAGLRNTNSGQCVFLGRSAGQDHRNGNDVVGIGNVAMAYQNGWASIGIGTLAGYGSTSQTSVLIGYEAGREAAGNNTVSVGHEAGRKATKHDCVHIGAFCGRNNTGRYCVAVGDQLLQGNSTNYKLEIGSKGRALIEGITNAATPSLTINGAAFLDNKDSMGDTEEALATKWYVDSMSGSQAGFTPLEGTAMDIAPSGSDYVFNVDLNELDSRYSSKGNETCGSQEVIADQRVYTISHSISGDYCVFASFIGVDDDVSVSSLMITNKIDGYFDVVLGGSPSISGNSIDWFIKENISFTCGTEDVLIGQRTYSISHSRVLPYFVNLTMECEEDQAIMPAMVTNKSDYQFDIVLGGTPSISSYKIDWIVCE